VLICGDLHLPYHDQKAVDAFLCFARKYKPDVLVVGGDFLDCEAVSRFLKDPRKVASLQKEFDDGRDLLRQLRRLASRCIFLEGNHEVRVAKHVLRNAPALSDLRCLDVRSQLGAEDWEWVPYPAFAKIGKLVVLHGESYNAGTNAKNLAKYSGHSVAQGHSHRLSQLYVKDVQGVRSACEWGCLADLHPHYCHRPNWQHGFCVWEHGQLQTHLILNGKVLT
jgi:hypothetical protein